MQVKYLEYKLNLIDAYNKSLYASSVHLIASSLIHSTKQAKYVIKLNLFKLNFLKLIYYDKKHL